MIPEDQKIWLHNDEVRGDFLQPPHRHLTLAVVSNIKLMKLQNVLDVIKFFTDSVSFSLMFVIDVGEELIIISYVFSQIIF